LARGGSVRQFKGYEMENSAKIEIAMDFREKRGPITIAIANNWAWLVIASLLAKRQTQDIRASLFLDG